MSPVQRRARREAAALGVPPQQFDQWCETAQAQVPRRGRVIRIGRRRYRFRIRSWHYGVVGVWLVGGFVLILLEILLARRIF